MKKVIIIGAGPAGLGAGLRLLELGCPDFLILEKNPYPGGLSASFKTPEGFIFDLGGHVFFSKAPYFRETAFSLLKDEIHFHTRNASVYLGEQVIPYPFQDNIADLAQEVQLEIARDFLEISSRGGQVQSRRKRPFSNWLLKSFGKTLSQLFLLPYNRKVWACDLKKMGSYWIDERVSTLTLEDILERIILGKKKRDWGPNAEFFFPHLGIGYLFEKMAQRLQSHILYNHPVTSVDLKNKTVITVKGENIQYNSLVSSMPVTELIKRLAPGYSGGRMLSRAAATLRCNSGYILGLGIDFKIETGKHWVYFPEKEFPWFRLTVISNYSPAMAPAGTSSLLFDTSYNPYRGLNVSAKDIIPLLKKITFLPPIEAGNIISVFEKTVPYFYPIPTMDRDTYLSPALAFLEQNGVYSVGRFGKWRYEEGNMDHSFLHGKAAAESVLKK